MGQEIHELRGVFSGDSAKFEAAANRAIAAAKQFGQSWGTVASETIAVGGRIAASITGVAAAMGTAVAVTGGKFNALKENATIAFSTILKDGTKARAFLADLQKFAAETPFSFGGLIQQSQFLLATGFKLQEIQPALRVLGDAMSALGKGEEGLKGVALALSQMRSSANLMASDMMQLTNQGIPAWQILAEKIGKTVGETRKLSESGAIGGEQAYQLIMQGLQERFGGGMQSAAGSFDQLLSNLKDTFDIRAGEVTAPLFEALKNVFKQFLDYLGGAEFNGVIDTLKEQFAEAGRAFERFVGDNKEAIVRSLTDALSGLAQGVANLMAWAEEAGPSLRTIVSSLFEFVQMIGRFVAQYPQVVVALSIWKGADMLGAVSLMRSLGAAILNTVTAIWSMIAAQRAGAAASAQMNSGLTTVIGGVNNLKMALSGAAAAAIVAGFFAVLQNAAAKLRAELAAVRAEADQVRGVGIGNARAEFDAAMGQRDPNARANHLGVARDAAAAQVEIAKRDFENRQKELDRVQQNMGLGDKLGAMLPENMGGFDEREDLKGEIAKAEKAMLDAMKLLKEIESAVAKAKADGAAGGEAGAGAAGAGALGAPGGAVDLGPSKEDVKAAAKAERAVEKDAQQQAEDWDRMLGEAWERMSDFAQKLVDMTNYVDQEAVTRLGQSMQRISDAYLNGEISAEQYRRAVGDINQVADGVARTTEAFQKAATSGQITGEQMEALNGRLNEMVTAYQNGEMTSEGFARGMRFLNDEMAKAIDLTEREAQAEERKRLMRGEFTQEEYQTAYEDKIIQFQRQRMQQQVDAAANQWAAANGFVSQAGQSFNQLNGYMSQFGRGVQQATGFLSGMGGGGNAFASLSALFSNAQVNSAMIFNQIQQLKQILTLPSVSYDRKQQVQQQIDDLQNQLNAPAPPPMFVGLTGNGQIVDPGLQSQSATGGRSMTLNVSLPNLTQVSNSQMKELVDRISDEMARQGRRL